MPRLIGQKNKYKHWFFFKKDNKLEAMMFITGDKRRPVSRNYVPTQKLLNIGAIVVALGGSIWALTLSPPQWGIAMTAVVIGLSMWISGVTLVLKSNSGNLQIRKNEGWEFIDTKSASKELKDSIEVKFGKFIKLDSDTIDWNNIDTITVSSKQYPKDGFLNNDGILFEIFGIENPDEVEKIETKKESKKKNKKK